MSISYEQNLNRGRFETWTIKPDMNFYGVHQVHGIDIATPETLPAQADGIMTAWDDLDRPLAIKTADCLPIVIEGQTGVIFLHAGWKGLAHGILKRPEISLIIPHRVLIGPSIHSCCFEVSEDFKNNFPSSPHFKRNECRWHFDLQQESRDQLRELFPNLLVEITPICTGCNKKFHSYRMTKTEHRNWNLYIKG